jgi:hypothetical protein
MSATVDQNTRNSSNGAAMAALLGAGIGAFAMGFFAIVNEAGVFTAPSLYGPAGGVSGRTTFATVVWLLAWGILHSRWNGRSVKGMKIFRITLLLVALSLLLTFPPVWALV